MSHESEFIYLIRYDLLPLDNIVGIKGIFIFYLRGFISHER